MSPGHVPRTQLPGGPLCFMAAGLGGGLPAGARVTVGPTHVSQWSLGTCAWKSRLRFPGRETPRMEGSEVPAPPAGLPKAAGSAGAVVGSAGCRSKGTPLPRSETSRTGARVVTQAPVYLEGPAFLGVPSKISARRQRDKGESRDSWEASGPGLRAAAVGSPAPAPPAAGTAGLGFLVWRVHGGGPSSGRGRRVCPYRAVPATVHPLGSRIQVPFAPLGGHTVSLPREGTPSPLHRLLCGVQGLTVSRLTAPEGFAKAPGFLRNMILNRFLSRTDQTAP